MKSIRFVPREWKWSYITTIFACSVIAIALPLLLNFMQPVLLEPVELWTVDLRFQHRPPVPVSDDPSQDRSGTVVAFDYDDRAAYAYGLGRWPWDRRVHAQVLDLLSKSGARAVLVDLLFEDRKSTRLNSSHSQISYAVFCLKKKKKKIKVNDHQLESTYTRS